MSHPVQTESLPSYRITRSARKTLALHVRDQCVEVRAPHRVGDLEIGAFVHQHRDWIRRMLQQQAQQSQQRLRLVDGGMVYYKGRELPLQIHQSQRPDVVVRPERLIISVQSGQEDRVPAVFRHWLMAQARLLLIPRTHALARHMGLGERLNDVVLRKTRSKWGHCTAGGRIQYNWLIMMAPDAVIDYMISHEVCHLVHMNHSAEFWALVASLCPQHRECRQWLRKNGHRLWFD